MSTTMRQEEDFIGTREIDDRCYYGIHTLRACENFAISATPLNRYPSLIKGLVVVKKAAALTYRQRGSLPPGLADAIVKACDDILLHDRFLDQFPIDLFQGGAGTSTNMNVNEVVANVALERLGRAKGDYQFLSPNDHVNRGQSTNDVYPTGFRLAFYQDVQDKLLPALQRLKKALAHKGTEFSKVIKMGRTQLQDAVPMTLGQEFKAFASLIDDEIRQLAHDKQPLLMMHLGGTAIGTGVNTDAGYGDAVIRTLAELTDLPLKPVKDRIAATSDCGAYVTLSNGLRRLATRLSKICNDLRLLSSGPRAGLNEINLPQRQAGSSIMPAKVNPVIPEVVNQVCFKVIGNDTCVVMAAEAGQLQLNVMEPVIVQSVLESISLLTNGIDTLVERCIDGITANASICRDYVMGSVGMVSCLNPVLGHHAGDLIGQACLATGKSVREVVLEQQLLGAQELDRLLDPMTMIAPKAVMAGS